MCRNVHRCQLYCFPVSLTDFLSIGWLTGVQDNPYGYRYLQFERGKIYMYFRQLLSAFYKNGVSYLYHEHFPAIFGVDRIPVCIAQAQTALLSMRTQDCARVACIASQLHCAITNRATEHAHGTGILSQNAFLNMRRRLMHRNW